MAENMKTSGTVEIWGSFQLTALLGPDGIFYVKNQPAELDKAVPKIDSKCFVGDANIQGRFASRHALFDGLLHSQWSD